MKIICYKIFVFQYKFSFHLANIFRTLATFQLKKREALGLVHKNLVQFPSGIDFDRNGRTRCHRSTKNTVKQGLKLKQSKKKSRTGSKHAVDDT